MAITYAGLYAYASIPTIKTDIINAEGSTQRVIRKATFTNNSGATVTVDLYIKPDGVNEIRIADTKVLVATETWSCPDAEGHILEAAGTMAVVASAANVELVISGFKVT